VPPKYPEVLMNGFYVSRGTKGPLLPTGRDRERLDHPAYRWVGAPGWLETFQAVTIEQN